MARKFLKLRSGALIDEDAIQCMFRKDLNEYALVSRDCPVTLKLDADDMTFLQARFEVIEVPKTEPMSPALPLIARLEKID